jgi:menaquinone-dependent protoporphyrinogen oxidase
MKVAVVYASKHGSTREIAERIGAVLKLEGADAEVLDAEHPPNLDGYDAVVLGSAVYAGRWRSEARRFVRRHRDQLTALPLWLFSSGPVGEGAEDPGNAHEPRRVHETSERLGARDHVVFGGRVPEGPDAGFIAHAMAEKMTPEERDARNWDAIEAWARGIALELGAARTT